MQVAAYMSELWLGELYPPAFLDTGAMVDALLKEDSAAINCILSPHYTPAKAEHLRLEMHALLCAIRLLFGDNFHQHNTAALDVDLILAVLDQVAACGDIPDASPLRKRLAVGRGSSLAHALPQQILPRLQQLVQFVSEHMAEYALLEKGVERTTKEFLLAALFLS